jgi:tetratricopeptide (TPR) repeat protein
VGGCVGVNEPDRSAPTDQSPDADRGLDADVVAHKLDTLVRGANIHVMQGRLGEAISACQEGLALEPDHPDVRELLGDILARQGKRQAAIAEYRAVFEAHPDRISAERKIAEISLMVGEQMRLLERQRELVEDPSKRKQTPNRTRRALFSSLVLPGLAQLYLGAYFKGAALLITTLALLYYILQKVFLEPLAVGGGPGRSLTDAVAKLPAYFAAYPLLTKLLMLAACFLILGAYTYGVIDALRMVRAEQDQRDAALGI